jgi:hypothetical protein
MAAKDMKALRCQRCSRRLRKRLMNSAVAFAATHEVAVARGLILAWPKVRKAES